MKYVYVCECQFCHLTFHVPVDERLFKTISAACELNQPIRVDSFMHKCADKQLGIGKVIGVIEKE